MILASASPRRKELLERLGLPVTVDPAHIDEAALPDESPTDHVERLAREKAGSVAERHPGALVIGGDTVVILEREILGKPESEDDAVAMLLRLEGRRHRVETGVAVVAPDGRVVSEVVGAEVRFRPFARELAEAYVATGEPMDKAGGYGIQGYGAVLVDGIDGDYFAVMGLPLAAVAKLLGEAGHPYRFPTGPQSRGVSRPGTRIAVAGAGVCGPELHAVAEAVGRGIAEAGAALICGGLGGVMEAASRGAAGAGGLTVGILPGTDAGDANGYTGVPLPTGMGEMRNVLVARTADVLIAIGGEWGTLSEVAMARKCGVPVVLLEAGLTAGLDLPTASDAGDAVRVALDLAGRSR